MSLEFNRTYNLHCGLTLASGRELILDHLCQKRTYAGCMGVPTADTNEFHLKYFLQTAQCHCAPGEKPFLIPPVRRGYHRIPGDMQSLRPWVAEWLPEVACIATFMHHATVRDASKHISMLTVMWFQHEFALPILEPALTALLQIDWGEVATDVEL